MEKKEFKMIKCNLVPEFEMRMLDARSVYVKLTRITSVPGKLIPDVSYQFKCLPLLTYENMEAMRYAKQPQIWYRNGGFSECQVLSHPGKWTPEQLKEIEEEWNRVFPKKVITDSTEERLQRLESENKKHHRKAY